MDQERDVKDTGDEQSEKGTSTDDHSEQCRNLQHGRHDRVALEVLRDIPPLPTITFLGQVDGVERERIDGLARGIGKEKTLPALECEEDEEGEVIRTLCGRGDVVKEAEVRVGACGARLALLP